MSKCLIIAVVLFLLCQQAFTERWVPLKKQFRLFKANEERQILFSKTEKPSGFIISVNLSGLFVDEKHIQKRDFSSVRLPKESYSTHVGKPRLPVVRRLIKVPQGSYVRINETRTNWQEIKLQDLNLQEKILPLQPSQSKGDKEKPKFEIDTNYYMQNQFEQEGLVKIGRELFIKGEVFRAIEIFPFSYNPAKNTLRIASEIDFEIEFEGGFKKEEKEAYIQKGLLFITGSEFLNNELLKEFILWKRKLGFEVKAVSMDEVGASPIDVRNYLINEYNAWDGPYLNYLLIIGDVEHVPAHKGSAYKTQYTDNYYAALDTENYEDDLTTPDISVGRIPAKNSEELELMLRKILKYERADFGKTNWIKKISFIGTDDTQWYQVAEGTHNYVLDTYTKDMGYTGIFPTSPMIGGDQLYAITHNAETNNLVSAFNDGRSIINYSGHGNYTYWAGPNFSNIEINQLNHPDALPYIMSNACITGSFAMSGDSFSELFLKAESGALSFFSASNNSYWDEDDVLERRIWDRVFRDKVQRIGDFNFYGMEQLRLHYNNSGKVPYYYEIYNLMGDPTIRLYTEIPKPLTIVANPIILGQNKFDITIYDENTPVQNIIVHVQAEDDEIESIAKTNENGIATFTLEDDFLQPQNVTLTASGRNYIVSQVDVQVISPAGPYFAIEDFEILNSSEGIHPFEPFSVGLKLKNIGSQGGSLQLEMLTIPEGLSYQGVDGEGCNGLYFEPGEVKNCQGGYQFVLNEMVSNNTILNVQMLASYENNENVLKFIFPVKTASYDISDIVFEETTGNMNGNPDPGEYLNLSMSVKNVGAYLSDQDVLVITFPESCVEVMSSASVILPKLEVAGATAINFGIHILETCSNGSSALFGATIKSERDNNFIHLDTSFKQVVGTVKEITLSSDTLLEIPDNNPEGITSEIEVSDKIIIEKIEVFVDVAHTYIGDLEITLISPDGKESLLHGRTGASLDDIVGWYESELEPKGSLDVFKNTMGFGSWRLKVSDRASQDTGTINLWKLKLAGYLGL